MYVTFLLLLYMCVCLLGRGERGRALFSVVLAVTTFDITFLGGGVGWSKLIITAKMSVVSETDKKHRNTGCLVLVIVSKGW